MRIGECCCCCNGCDGCVDFCDVGVFVRVENDAEMDDCVWTRNGVNGWVASGGRGSEEIVVGCGGFCGCAACDFCWHCACGVC